MRIFVLAIGFVSTAVGQGDWPSYARDAGGQRFSPLTQVTTRNVARLKPAWQYGLQQPGSSIGNIVANTEATPIVVGGVMYVPTSQRTIVALEPETGKELWKYELGRTVGAPLRGVTYWGGDAQSPAEVLGGTSDGKLIAINAKTGKLVPGFGNEGVVDLKPGVADNFPNAAYHISSPGAVYRNLIITGAQGQEDSPDGPAMDVRAWDVRTGKLAWTFHPFPHPGETGYDTWPKDNWATAGSPANWGANTIDAQRGLVFVPIGQPSPQYYGGNRPGQNLFSASIIALDANTGKLKWYFQLTHHDMWDLDAEAAPSLVDIVHSGKRIPALVAISKTSMMFFLDRETGKPIYPVEERPVPKSEIPGEESWPTQPFTTKPPPLARLGITADEVFKGEPEHEKFCRDLVATLGGLHNAGPFTPYSHTEYRVVFPGQQGGANWGGVAIDPRSNYVFVNTRDVGGMGRMDKQTDGGKVAYRRSTPLGDHASTRFARFWDPEKQLPCQQPPWAHLTAVNANTGDIAWRVPLGTSEEMEGRGIHETGAFGQGGPMATAGGLVFIAGTNDKGFRAFDSKTGKALWETRLDAQGTTNPITYMGRDGKQYVAVVSTGVNAFALSTGDGRSK